METRSAKRKKLLDVDDNGESGEDRLTDLPDAILHHILFLLPIKSIAQTCVLSKRWRHIWYSFPDLDFTTLKQHHGMAFINHFLSIRAKQHCCSDIRVLRLGASLMLSQLNSLMRCAVLKHNVQHLEIDVFTDDYFNLPRSVLKSDSLKVLKLKFLGHGFRLLPWSIMKDGFRSLNTLSLSLVICNEQPNIFMDRSSLPLLEELSMDKCRGLKHLKVYCQALVKFTLSECWQLDNLEISCPKLEKMRVSRCFNRSSNNLVMIDAPKLEKIIWNCNAITDQSSLRNLRSLQEASVCFESVTSGNLASMSHFFIGLSQSKCLKLETPCFELLSRDRHFARVIFEAFVNLKLLELHTSKIRGLASLFRTSLSLHKLIISITSDSKVQKIIQLDRNLSSSSSGDDEQFWKSQSQAFKPFLHELKSVTIHGISESVSEFSLVKFLLGHTRVLQEMVISCAAGRGCRRLERIESRVMQYYRASSDAKIVVVH